MAYLLPGAQSGKIAGWWVSNSTNQFDWPQVGVDPLVQIASSLCRPPPTLSPSLVIMSHDNDPLVFSTNGVHLRQCPSCGKHPCACSPEADVVPEETLLRLRLDQKGRGGKTVTVVFDLPSHPDYLASLIKKLKTHCGTGGALKEGRMEIQGDQRDKVQAYLERLGFTVRRSGGGGPAR